MTNNSTYMRPVIPAGNSFYINIALDKFIDGAYDEFDLTKATDLKVYLICATHNTEIPLPYEIIPGIDNVLKCFVDYRLLHTTSYGIAVEGYDEHDIHFRFLMLPKEGFLVVNNTSGMKVTDDVQIVDISGRVGWGIQTDGDLSNYYTKTEVNNIIAQIEVELGNTYTKEEINQLLTQYPTKTEINTRFNDYYTKTQTDNLLNQKANKSELATVATTGDYDDLDNKPDLSVYATQSDLVTKQDVLISGVNIKTINEQSILGTGNITIQGGGGDNDEANEVTANALYDLNERLSEAEFNIELIPPQLTDLQEDVNSSLEEMNTTINEQFTEIDDEFKSAALVIENLNTNKQDTLVSGVNIKTINSESIIGTGNIVIQGSTQVNSDWNATTGVEMILNKPSIQTNYVIDYSKTYLTFEAIQDTTFTFTRNALQYSLDNGTTWISLSASTASPTVTAGNKIMWKQNNLTPDTNYGLGTFSATGNFNAYGNTMSLYYGDNFIGQTDLTGKEYALAKLFYNNTYLKDASNLILPAKTLSNACYYEMFYGCTALKPAPELPATTLATNCYVEMFYNCTSLTTAPELPAATLTNYCYQKMFNKCTHLNFIKCQAINLNATNCLQYWTTNVATSGKFIKALSITSWPSGTSGIPSNWTVYTYSEYEYPYRYEIPSPTGIVYSSTNGLKIEVVNALPASPDSNTIYIVN